MKIYVASSWKNKHQPEVVDRLRNEGHEVYDFKDAANAFDWRNLNFVGGWNPDSCRQVLEHSQVRRAFTADMQALRLCELCVIVTPCGNSAHMEAGWAVGANKKLIIYYAEGTNSPDVMHLMADAVVVGVTELIAEVKKL